MLFENILPTRWQLLRFCLGHFGGPALWLLAAAQVAPLYAVTVEGLYQAEVTIANAGDRAREEGERQALRAVLVKLTGRESVDLDTIAPAGTVDMAAIVEQSQIREGADANSSRLWVSFDQAGVDSLLARSGVSTWPRTRPRTIFLVAIEEGGARRVVGADDDSGLPGALRAAARRRGLPMVLPLMDLRDRQMLTVADIWAGFDTRLRQVGARYRSEAMVHARMLRLRAATRGQANGGGRTQGGASTWEAVWTLTLGQTSRNWTRGDLSEQALALALVGTAVDEMAAAFADISPGSNTAIDGHLLLLVHGIDSPSAYGRTLSYLKALDLVEEVAVLEVRSGKVLFALSTSASASAVLRLVEIGATLAFVQEGEVAEYRLLY